jgi:hypothetical protein
MSARRALLALSLFGISFGYLEAAVVVYLRHIYDPIRARVYPNHAPGELFPLLMPHHLPDPHLLAVELGREFATLVMLAAAAVAVTRNRRQWLAAFGLVFGVWDIFFYLFLKATINWPASPFTWDILFLLPGPWVGPVIAPCIVSATMIAAGAAAILSESKGRAVPITRWHGALILVGALTVTASFLWDWRNTTAGHLPNPFNWPLFWSGELAGAAAFIHAWRRRVTVH